MIRRNGGLLVIALIILGSFGCAGSFHSKSIKHVDETSIKAALEQRQQVRISSIYKHKSSGADYIFLIEKVDQDSIYGRLESATVKYHKTIRGNFRVKRELNIDGVPTELHEIGNPGDVLHLYTTNQALAEGNFNIAIGEIRSMDIHKKGKSTGSIIAISLVAAPVLYFTGLILFYLLFYN